MLEPELLGQGRHGHRVLEQAAEVGVVARLRARRPPPGRPERGVAEQGVEQPPVLGVADLAGQMLEEAVELVEVAVGGREEGARIDRPGRGALDPLELELELLPEAGDPTDDADEIAPVEAPAEQVGVPEGPPLDRAGPVAELDAR